MTRLSGLGRGRDMTSAAALLAAHRTLDTIDPRAVVAWASQAVADGSESPALLALASEYPGAETRSIDAGLEAYLAEQGVRSPDPLQSALLVCGEVAARVRAGEVDPVVGGQWIVGLAHHAQDDPRLFAMRSVVDDWENIWPKVPALVEEIRAEALHLEELREEVLRVLTKDQSRAAPETLG